MHWETAGWIKRMNGSVYFTDELKDEHFNPTPLQFFVFNKTSLFIKKPHVKINLTQLSDDWTVSVISKHFKVPIAFITSLFLNILANHWIPLLSSEHQALKLEIKLSVASNSATKEAKVKNFFSSRGPVFSRCTTSSQKPDIFYWLQVPQQEFHRSQLTFSHFFRIKIKDWANVQIYFSWLQT